MYLLYDEYEQMGGTLDETVFNDLEFEAEAYVDWYTFNRLNVNTEYPPKLKRCMYHIIKLIELKMNLMAQSVSTQGQSATPINSPQIASMSNDGVSISYNIVSAHDALFMTRKEVDQTIEQHLAGVTNSLGQRLLYRGIYPNE